MPESAAILRHDLANPISLIVGYAELIMAEASNDGSATIAGPLGSIRRVALSLLDRIDRVLLAEPACWTAEEFRQLGEDLLGPALLLVQETDALLGAARLAGLGVGVSDDLDKIRSAGVHLVVLIEALEAGSIADA